MLTLTETATSAVKTIIAQIPDASDGGLRFERQPHSDRDFAVSVVPGPLPGDSTVEAHGARVFLEPETSQILDDKTLDAQVGDNGSVTFALLPQLA